jgi:hypothetical protein
LTAGVEVVDSGEVVVGDVGDSVGEVVGGVSEVVTAGVGDRQSVQGSG